MPGGPGVRVSGVGIPGVGGLPGIGGLPGVGGPGIAGPGIVGGPGKPDSTPCVCVCVCVCVRKHSAKISGVP